MTPIIASEAITARIYFIRGTSRVMLDRDLAELYGVKTGGQKKYGTLSAGFYV